jgi:hypothetical protein
MAGTPLRNISNLTFFLNEGQSRAARGYPRAGPGCPWRFLTGRAGAGWENYQVHGLGRAGPKTFWILRAGPARAAVFHGLQCSSTGTQVINSEWFFSLFMFSIGNAFFNFILLTYSNVIWHGSVNIDVLTTLRREDLHKSLAYIQYSNSILTRIQFNI